MKWGANGNYVAIDRVTLFHSVSYIFFTADEDPFFIKTFVDYNNLSYSMDIKRSNEQI